MQEQHNYVKFQFCRHGWISKVPHPGPADRGQREIVRILDHFSAGSGLEANWKRAAASMPSTGIGS
ncbi:MAG: hypothetical protein R2839_03395 [Thermomicrobiales bacterium]